MAAGWRVETHIWDVETEQVTATFEEIPFSLDRERRIAFSPDGKTLAVLNESPELWDIQTHTLNMTFTNFQTNLPTVLLSPNGRTLITCGKSTIQVSDLQTGEIKTLEQGLSGFNTALAVSPDWATFTAAAQGAIGSRQISPMDQPFPTHSNRMANAAFSPDSTLLAVSGEETVWLWDVQSGELHATLLGDGRTVAALAFTSGGRRLLIFHSDKTENKVVVWDAMTGRPIGEFSFSLPSQVRTYVFSPNGRFFAAGDQGDRGENSSAKVWDVATGQPKYTLDIFRPMSMFAFSADSTLLAEANHEKPVVLREMDTLRVRYSLGAPTDKISVVAFNPAGTQLAAACDDETIRVWDTHTGEIVYILTGNTAYIWQVIFSPDGTRLASGNSAGAIHMWDMHTGQAVGTPGTHAGVIQRLAFSPAGTSLISKSQDATIRLWAIENSS